MGRKNADKMLKEGYKAKAQEALEMGLISEVVSHDQLLARAQVGRPCRLQPAPHNISGARGGMGKNGERAEAEGRGQRGGVHQGQHRGVPGPCRCLRVG